MTTTPSDKPEMMRFRFGKLSSRGGVSIENSLTIAPCFATRSNSSRFCGGYTWQSPQPITATVRPSTSNAPRCAAESIPAAPPLTMVNPACASALPNRAPCSSPYAVQPREPTIAAAYLSRASSSEPRTYNTTGPSGNAASSDGYRASSRQIIATPSLRASSSSRSARSCVLASDAAMLSDSFSPMPSTRRNSAGEASHAAAALPNISSNRRVRTGPSPSARCSRSHAIVPASLTLHVLTVSK